MMPGIVEELRGAITCFGAYGCQSRSLSLHGDHFVQPPATSFGGSTLSHLVVCIRETREHIDVRVCAIVHNCPLLFFYRIEEEQCLHG